MPKFNRKAIRAHVVVNYALALRASGIVCFSCGNAAKAIDLVANGVIAVDHVGPEGSFIPNHWWAMDQIAHSFPGKFDATSGHLAMPLVKEIGDEFRKVIGPLGPGPFEVACGSGETIIALAAAYPDTLFDAVYDDKMPATKWDKDNPLNCLVNRIARSVYRRNSL